MSMIHLPECQTTQKKVASSLPLCPWSTSLSVRQHRTKQHRHFPYVRDPLPWVTDNTNKAAMSPPLCPWPTSLSVKQHRTKQQHHHLYVYGPLPWVSNNIEQSSIVTTFMSMIHFPECQTTQQSSIVTTLKSTIRSRARSHDYSMMWRVKNRCHIRTYATRLVHWLAEKQCVRSTLSVYLINNTLYIDSRLGLPRMPANYTIPAFHWLSHT